MSASPTIAASTKRPLEEPSSPAGPNDQPDAKRPALDKLVKEETDADDIEIAQPVKGESVAAEDVKREDAESSNDAAKVVAQNGEEHVQADTVVPDAPAILETQPIQSTSGANGRPSNGNQQVDESNWLHLRACIGTSEAATIIGKGGENVTQIRRLSGAKCTVSDYSRGAVERILTVSGQVDAVSKAFGLIVRTLNQEDLENPSTSTSKAYPMRLLIPHILIGSIIGKAGVRIREIQEASNAKLNASDTLLPNSGERSLVVLGVADAVHIAVYYVAQTLVEQLTERFGGPAASQYATRSGMAANVVPGGMSVQPYVPQPAGGQYSQPHPNNFRRPEPQRTPQHSYGAPHMHSQPPQPTPYGHPNMPYGAGSPGRAHYGGPAQPTPYGGHHAASPDARTTPLTQQIFIPNDMVGAIIGKGGAKINEIRQLSGSVIKINEPTDNSNERLVTITGTQECNQMALYMLYSRLGQIGKASYLGTYAASRSHCACAKFAQMRQPRLFMTNLNVYQAWRSELRTSFRIGVAYSTEASQSRVLTNLPPPYTWTGARAGELRANPKDFTSTTTLFIGPKLTPFSIHTSLLVSQSPYFRAALTGPFVESKTKTITLDDVSPDHFSLLVSWLYTSAVPAPFKDAKPAYYTLLHLGSGGPDEFSAYAE
ncbi:PAB1 binding protein [Didymella sp. IMI 355093]|nr:PAB1 binding protein [Didymella sp. IMI 355093]